MRMSAKRVRRSKTHQPRAAYCTGCGNTFDFHHQLINHRRTDRCGGRFLPQEEREMIDKLRLEREALLRRMREEDKEAPIP